MSEPVARTRLFVAACAGMFIFGIVLALLGTLFGLPEMRARLQVNLAQQGDLFLLLYFGILLANLFVGPLIDRSGHRPTLLVSSLLVTAALGGFALANGFAAAAFAALLLGVGGGGLNTSTNALVSELYREARGAMLNVLGIFLGIGALFIPLLAASISAYFSVNQLLLFSAGLTLVCAVAYGALKFPAAREAAGFSLREAANVARYPGVLLFAFLLFFQSGNEASIAGWTSTYLGSRGASAAVATWVLAGYWAALMLGRLLSARLLGHISKGQLVVASAIGSIAGCVLLLAAPTIPVMAAGVFLTGLGFAGIFPTVLAMAGDRYERFAGTVFGLLFAVAVVGGMTFPWAIGHISEEFGVRSGMLVPIAGTSMICLLVALILRRA